MAFEIEEMQDQKKITDTLIKDNSQSLQEQRQEFGEARRALELKYSELK